MIMSPMHQYFTLLYHAYVQKWRIASDYPGKLEGFAKQIGATYRNDAKYSMEQLWDFMRENHYKISIPSEEEGTLNWNNIRYTDCYRKLRFSYFFRRQIWQISEKIRRKAVKLIKKLLHC